MGRPPGRLSVLELRPAVIDRAVVLAQYDREMRRDPPPTTGVTFVRTSALVREQQDADTIVFSELTEETARSTVREEAQRARSLGRELEWKVYAHDRPPGLPALLKEEGFRPDEPETLVVLDLADRPTSAAAGSELVVREVSDLRSFQDALLVSRAAFGPSGPETLETYRERLTDPTARLFVAYGGDRPASAGRLELAPGRAFASLWGGGTVPEARHRGAYRALVEARADRAWRSGYRYLTVDARETSRPILERLGFVSLTGVQGWILPAPTGSG